MEYELLFDRMSISAMAAQYVAQACVRGTLDTDVPVAVVVLDSSGNLKAALRMDEVPAHCTDRALRSAERVIATRNNDCEPPTSGRGRSRGARGVGTTTLASDRLDQSGRLLLSGGRIVGALGVSGLPSAQNASIASVGARALKTLVEHASK